ncbi:Upc2 protein [Colletotrichum higginsianum IMI 349063]|uniref:Upc2 protein n=2 Tax=Colletotrichum higginsianum TaxID=80884 RepID=A0A1B7Y8Z2_COLHI|nr:Upc2 protein [Colletotrichum higginsianum IMI 349063]OBR08516.1 Upc2 protein [Colletotrichum higginsianum IMI 349063]TIC95667.1 Sterol uptake control protein 2 [Colletotrichum higginsianum]GJC97407.1 upc2 protein [Colletotrichum higginsianum]
MRQRTPHRKSRFGCKECKQRHVKCDESRPACVNCATGQRRCSFLDTESSMPSSTSAFLYQCPSPATSIGGSSPNTAGGGLTPAEPASYRSAYPPTEPYDFRHMELLYHFEHGLGATQGFGDDPTRERYQKMSLKQAIRTPYLMDELLAIAAAHKSTLPGEDQAFYRGEATRLQTRGLAQFNATNAEVSNDNFLAVFLYSTWLSQHVLFDAFSSSSSSSAAAGPAGFSETLDKLVHCMGLHRGVRTIVGGSWHKLKAHLDEHMGPGSPFVDSIIIGHDRFETGDECRGLSELFDRDGDGGRNEASRAALAEAVEHLQLMFDVQRNTALTAGRRRSTVIEWSIRAPTAYVGLLDQRRPEALVVLAYWGVLLHRAREAWTFGDAGRTLVWSLAAHLGSYWSEWLAWPQAEVGSPGDSASSPRHF